MANSAIQLPGPAVIAPEGVGGLRNKAVNGQFDLWQRGTTFIGPGTPVFYADYTADRWVTGGREDGGVWDVTATRVDQQSFVPGQTEVPNNPTFFARYQARLSTPSVGNDEFHIFAQRIENTTTLSDQKITCSFYARGTAGDVMNTVYTQTFGVGGSLQQDSNFAPVTLTSTFKRYVVVFDVPSVTGKTILVPLNQTQVSIQFFSQMGSVLAAANGTIPVSVNNPIDIANVQVEAGEIADPEFEKRPLALELSLAQRYYETGRFNTSAFAITAFSNEQWIDFLVTKRVTPAVVGQLFTTPPSGSNLAPGFILIPQGLNGFGIFYASVGGGDTNVQFSNLAQSAQDDWTADSEL